MRSHSLDPTFLYGLFSSRQKSRPVQKYLYRPDDDYLILVDSAQHFNQRSLFKYRISSHGGRTQNHEEGAYPFYTPDREGDTAKEQEQIGLPWAPIASTRQLECLHPLRSGASVPMLGHRYHTRPLRQASIKSGERHVDAWWHSPRDQVRHIRNTWARFKTNNSEGKSAKSTIRSS